MQAVDGERAEHRVVQHENDDFGWGHATALILLATAVALAPYVTAHFGFRGFVTIHTFAALAWLPLRNSTVRPAHAFVIALALRAPLLFAEPLLSGDVRRYLSDGRVLASGRSPYEYTPTDPHINHPEIGSIYPPHAQLLFGVAHDLIAWRLVIIAFDVAAMFLLRRHAFAYATFPTLVFEGTWNGHIDAIAGVLLAIAFLRSSGSAAAFASGLKIIPLAAVPALLRRARNRRRFALTFLAVLALPILPFLGGPIMPGFRDYATRWIFNSPLYDVLFAILDRIPIREIWTEYPLRFQVISDFVYRHLYTDFVTRLVMATMAIAIIVCAKRASTAVAALLLCSPAIHPWYWLVLVPVSLAEATRWIWLALAAPMSYLLYDGVHPILVYALCYGVAAAKR